MLILDRKLRAKVEAFRTIGLQRLKTLFTPRIENIDWLASFGAPEETLEGSKRLSSVQEARDCLKNPFQTTSNTAFNETTAHMAYNRLPHQTHLRRDWIGVAEGKDEFIGTIASAQRAIAACTNVLSGEGFSDDIVSQKVQADITHFALYTYFSQHDGMPTIADSIVSVYEAGRLPCAWIPSQRECPETLWYY